MGKGELSTIWYDIHELVQRIQNSIAFVLGPISQTVHKLIIQISYEK